MHDLLALCSKEVFHCICVRCSPPFATLPRVCDTKSERQTYIKGRSNSQNGNSFIPLFAHRYSRTAPDSSTRNTEKSQTQGPTTQPYSPLSPFSNSSFIDPKTAICTDLNPAKTTANVHTHFKLSRSRSAPDQCGYGLRMTAPAPELKPLKEVSHMCPLVTLELQTTKAQESPVEEQRPPGSLLPSWCFPRCLGI